MKAAGRENMVRDLVKSNQTKKLISSLPPTIISSFTGARGRNIPYLNSPGTFLTPPAIVLVRRCRVSAGRRVEGSMNMRPAFYGMVMCRRAGLWTGGEN